MAEEVKAELKFDDLTLQQIADKKGEIRKRIETRLIEELKTSAVKKSERRKAAKIMEKIDEAIKTLIALDEAQDRKED